jgi:hypothetical protein
LSHPPSPWVTFLEVTDHDQVGLLILGFWWGCWMATGVGVIRTKPLPNGKKAKERNGKKGLPCLQAPHLQ